MTNPDYFENLPYSEFERLMRINYLGVVGVTKAAVRQMKLQPCGGRILFVSSLGGALFAVGLYSVCSALLDFLLSFSALRSPRPA